MELALPERATPEMIEAGAAQLVNFLSVRPVTAKRWFRQIYEAAAQAHLHLPEPTHSVSTVQPWSAALVAGFLQEAADTWRRLPGSAMPQRLRAWWPEIVRNQAEAYAMEPARFARVAPSSAALSRADAVVDWLSWLVEEQRLLVMARMNGISWPALAKRDGRSERTLRYRHAESIDALVARLNLTAARTFPFNETPTRWLARN